MSRQGSKPRPRGPAATAGQTGRKIGVALFWALAAYVIGMSARSVIPSLFWPDAAPRPAGKGVEVCAEEIDALERSLSRRVRESFAEHSLHGLTPFLAAWDERYAQLADCGPLEPARKDLGSLRTELVALLRSYAADPMKRQDRIRRALQALPAGSARSPARLSGSADGGANPGDEGGPPREI